MSTILRVSLAAERVVLGALIEDENLLADAIEHGLSTDDFSISDHARVYSAILDLHQDGIPADYLIVADHLGGSQQDYVLVGSLIDGVGVQRSHFRHHLDIVLRKSRLRKLVKLGEWIQTAVAKGAEPEEISGLVRQGLERYELTGSHQ